MLLPNFRVASFESSVDDTSWNKLFDFLFVQLELKIVKVVSAIHFIQFSEMLSPVDVLVVPYEFFEWASFDFVDSLMYLFEDFDVAVCYEGILKKSV